MHHYLLRSQEHLRVGRRGKEEAQTYVLGLTLIQCPVERVYHDRVGNATGDVELAIQ
jgi:hypothetical protein